eukprot:CAMPEP_0206029816 /NCGR_PEP_ID=MMETSP1464-20131121/47201_1 /ASSEMBLY_ACC=CAM_ASM_001124 /TAXON_ID=119497 /ORGANISM="Exanthemachrysis gayraliae, Strain RCC1523" /LENGTH=634 /DNA_ID=CAMNT_0053403913 /DNA_START=260 /DNA_END=2161 /DNA_ORIENTATION=-
MAAICNKCNISQSETLPNRQQRHVRDDAHRRPPVLPRAGRTQQARRGSDTSNLRAGLLVEDLEVLLLEPLGEHLAEGDERANDEGEHDGHLAHAGEHEEDDEAEELEEGELEHLLGGHVSHVREVGPARLVPDEEEPDAVEELVAADAGHAEVEEDADDHRARHEAQDGRGEHGDGNKDVHHEVGKALLEHARDLDLVAARGVLDHLGLGEGEEVRERAHGGRVGEGQAKDGARRVDEGAAGEEVEVVARRLGQLAVLAVDDHLGEVLVEVAEDGEADGRDGGEEDGPHGEGLGDAHGVNGPRAAHARLRDHVGGRKVRGHVEVLEVGDLGPRHEARRGEGGHEDGDDHAVVRGHVEVLEVGDLGPRHEARRGEGGHEDGDDHTVVAQVLADGRVEPVGGLEVAEEDGEAVGEDREDERPEGGAHAHAGAEDVDDVDEGRDDLDGRDERREDLLSEAGHVVHEAARVGDRKDHGEERRPHALPEAGREELEVELHADLVEDDSVGELGAGRAHDGDGLAREERVHDAGDGRGEEHLHDAELAVRAHIEDGAEGEGRGEAGEEAEEDGGEGQVDVLLGLEGVRPVGDVVRRAAADVGDQAAGGVPRPLEGPDELGVLGPLGRVVNRLVALHLDGD